MILNYTWNKTNSALSLGEHLFSFPQSSFIQQTSFLNISKVMIPKNMKTCRKIQRKDNSYLNYHHLEFITDMYLSRLLLNMFKNKAWMMLFLLKFFSFIFISQIY